MEFDETRANTVIGLLERAQDAQFGNRIDEAIFAALNEANQPLMVWPTINNNGSVQHE